MTAVLPDPSTRTAFSFVREIPAADPPIAHRHFAAKLAFETDPADVFLDLQRERGGIRLLDVRSAEAYEQCHIPGAVSLPTRAITGEAVEAAGLTKDELLVVYCWGPACNGATRAAAKLSALGYHVKEMIGGIEYWRLERHPVEGTFGERAPLIG